ncbi:MAG: aspartate aminotransferase family protein [Phycisphaeraceae bacterium]|nr:aspartate aminotransferase family protein [Phycisphaeraceae bacterium]
MFDLQALLAQSARQAQPLWEEHVNPSLSRVVSLLGYDVHFVRGQGAYLWDDKGDRYIDCLGGYAVFNVGRNHPVVRDALRQAMDADLPNLVKMGIPTLSGLLARELVKIAPGDLPMVFFVNSGAEGVETALKYARAATGRNRIVHCKKGFHGLTLGALSVNGGAEFRAGFGSLLEGCTQIPFNDLPSLEHELSRQDVAAFIVEPIQGKGALMPADDYLPAAAALCRKHGSLFIADEVQTGFGRTGKMFACEHWNVEPDILVVAKGLSGGYVPVGAVLCKKWIHEKVFTSLDRCMVHSTTFGQNDLAMAAGLATLHVLREEKIVENAAAMGELFKQRLGALIGKYEMVKEVRGRGLMVGLEFGPPSSLTLKMGWSLLHKLDESLFCQAILIPLMADHHVLGQVAGHHMDVIKLIPPLVISAADVEYVCQALEKVIAACHKFPGPAWEVGKRLSAGALKGRPKPVKV